MARNTSYEPGLEELVTRAVIEEMLADGRLIVESKSKADATLKIRIKRYGTVADAFSDDEFPNSTSAIAAADIFIINNLDKSTIGNFEDIEGRYIYTGDPRRTIEETEPNVKEQVSRSLAIMIVLNVLSGPYAGE